MDVGTWRQSRLKNGVFSFGLIRQESGAILRRSRLEEFRAEGVRFEVPLRSSRKGRPVSSWTHEQLGSGDVFE